MLLLCSVNKMGSFLRDIWLFVTHCSFFPDYFAGLSLKSQELMALFLVLKIYYSYTNFDVHTILIAATLITTLWVVYMMRVFLKSSYMVHEDNFPTHYLVIACAVMTLVVHPKSSDALINRLILAFGCYLETVAIMPQLRLMQNTKIVESLTAHYVFALGVTRFLSCARWILQVPREELTALLTRSQRSVKSPQEVEDSFHLK
ncbi:ER lumen protein-retaining receptor-like, partial [Phalaenopsis equestris]|uniref:ER lumen protein-retaining receptor-like n=1 Tax=Phalaenopsis equestris TaxID=78828 RepID=UPI0009E21C33